ncbi:MAG: peptidylprolyl isomerase [Cypionkella sp.]|nr:peptidylprolyl isomerase [Cypionkella sp.]
MRARFGEQVVISEAAIDRALTNLQVGGAQTVTLAEIVLDASPARRNAALAAARNLQIDFIKGRSFSQAARAVSIGTSARRGGALPAKRLSELPESIAVLVRGLDPGQVSPPIVIDDRLYMYQKLENGTSAVAQTGSKVVDYAEVSLPASGDPALHVAQMRAEVDSCDALFSYATSQRGMAVVRHKAVQPNAAAALQLLDTGEISPPLAGNRAVMLCARGLDPTKTASRDEVRLILRNQRLAAMADVYLSELRADALIRDP